MKKNYIRIIGILFLVVFLFYAVVNYSFCSADMKSGLDLKTIALAFRVYATEHEGNLPALSNTPGKLSPEPSPLYPQHIPKIFSTGKALSNEKAPYIERYIYLGEAVRSNQEMKLFFERYIRMTKALDSPNRNVWNMQETKNPEMVPLLIEFPRKYPGCFGLRFLGVQIPLSPRVLGGVVAYLDGHVEFHTYPSEWPMNDVFVEVVSDIASLTKD